MPVIRRRPLLRAAAIGGTAYYVGSKREQNKAQQDQIEQQQAQMDQMQQQAQPNQMAAAPAAPSEDDKFAELAKLGQLHDSGVLTDEEFAFEKAKILNS